MRKKHGIKRNSRMYIILGFTLLYVFGMILTTYLVKNEKALLGGESASQINQFMMKEIEDVQLLYNEDGTLSDYSLDYMQYILSSNTQYMNQYTMISSGLLDAEGNLLAHTSDCVYPTIPMYVNGEPSFHLIDVEKYFTEEEVAAFREYFRVESQKTYPKLDKGYGAKIAYDEENDELVHLYIYNTEERKIKEGDVETTTDVFLDTVFRWENPDYEDSELHYYSFETTIKQFMQFPYAQYGEESWLEWKQDEHLNNYLEGTREGNISKAVNERQRGKYENTYINRIYLGDNSEKDYGNPD